MKHATLVLFFVLTSAHLLPAQSSPISTPDIKRLLTATATALQKSPELQADYKFIDRLSFMGRIWGVDVGAERWKLNPDSIEALLRDNKTDEARALLGKAHEAWDARYDWIIVQIVEQLVRKGRAYEAVTLGDTTRVLVAALFPIVMAQSDSAKAANIRLLERVLKEGMTSYLSRAEVEGAIQQLLTNEEILRRWQATDSIAALMPRIAARIYQSSQVLARKLPQADSMVGVVHREILRVPDVWRRKDFLQQLQFECVSTRSDACSNNRIPVPSIPVDQTELRRNVEVAVQSGRWSAADSVLYLIRGGWGPHVEHIVSLVAIMSAHDRCAKGAVCDAGMDAWTVRRLRLAERAIQSAPKPHADSLRVYVAAVMAGRDNDRALRMARSVEDRIMREWALALVGVRLVKFDIDLARELLVSWPKYGFIRREVFDSALIVIARAERMRGDTSRAEKTLARAHDNSTRLRADLEWAEVLRADAQWDRARDVASDALRWWDPSTEPNAGPPFFDAFARLGLTGHLVYWAAFRPDPTDRAIASLTLVEWASRGRVAAVRRVSSQPLRTY